MDADIRLNALSENETSDVDPAAYKNAIQKTLQAMKNKNGGASKNKKVPAKVVQAKKPIVQKKSS